MELVSTPLVLGPHGGRAHQQAAGYERRRPEPTVLHRVVRENYKSFVALVEASGRNLPKYVTTEFDEYLKCGILAHGFLRLKCADCKAERLVAFSCRSRGFCPSCLGKRQALASEFLMDKILGGLPVRQFVLSFPFELRFLMARDSKLMSLVLAIVNRAIAGFYRRKAKLELGEMPWTGGSKDGSKSGAKTAAVTFIQRYDSSLNLNIHFHMLVVEGVWKQADASELKENPVARARLTPLGAPSNEEIERLTCAIRDRVKRLLERKGYSKASPGNDKQLSYESEGFFTDFFVAGAVIDELQSASIQSRLATGPNAGQRVGRLGQQIHMAYKGELKGPRCFAVDGYSLHANTFCQSVEREKLKRLMEYVARPPFANERIAQLPNGNVTLKLKRPFSDGTTHIVFTPLEFIEKLSALVPVPRIHLIRYAGAFATRCFQGSQLPQKFGPMYSFGPAWVRPMPIAAPGEEKKAPGEKSRSWARLLKKVFGIDVASCHACGGKNVKIIAAIMDPATIAKILNHVGIGPDIPEVAAASRAPQASFDW